MRLDSGVVTETPDAVHHEAVIPAKAGIHFDFLPGKTATTLLLRGVGMWNSEDSPFVFDSDPPRPGEKTTGRKAKDEGENGFRLSPE